MTKAYLSIGYANRQYKHAEIETIEQALAGFGINLLVFADTYKFTPIEEKQMMQQAFAEIDTAGLLIAEVSEKAIGVGIEIGYAVAHKIPVIYLRAGDSEHSTTAAGSSDYSLIYRDSSELATGLRLVLADFSRKATK